MTTPQPRQSRSRSYAWIIAAALLLLLTGWRMAALPHTYMRDDEEIAFRTTSGSLFDTLDYQANQDIQAPLWFGGFWLWQQAAGTTEFSGRVFALFFALLTAALVYRLSHQWFGAARFGWFALIVLIINSYFYIFSMEIRPYALVSFCAAVSMWRFERWLNNSTMRNVIWYGLTIALVLYVHYFLAFLILAQAIYFLVWGKPTHRLILQALAALALGIVLWLPWFPSFIHQLETLRRLAEEANQLYGLGIGTPSTSEPTVWATIIRLINTATNGQAVLFGGIFVLGGVLLRRNSRYWLALLWAVGVPVIALLLNTIVAVYSLRYVSYLSVGTAVAAGAALAALPTRTWRGIGMIGFTGLCLLGFSSQLPVRTPYRDIFQMISAHSQPGDVAYFTRADLNDNLVRWHVREYLAPTVQVVDAQNDLLHNIELQANRRVWFISAHLLEEDIQAQFHDLEPSHPVQNVLGSCNRQWCYVAQLMEAPPLQSPLVFGDQLPFYGMDVDEITAESVQARLWWKASNPPNADYSIGLHLLDLSGQLVAQRDGAINHYGVETVQTSQMRPNTIYMDQRELNFSPDLPAGDYMLALVVYQSSDGTRLTLPDGTDYLMLQTITIP